MSDSINFRKLKNPESRSFFDELQEAEESLTKKDAKNFFKIVLSHFESDLPAKTGNAILDTIKTVLADKSISQVFISNEFALYLPYSQKTFTSKILDIFYELVKTDASVFTSEVTNSFSALVSRSPSNCLDIFAIYSKNSFDLEDQMAVFELIVKKNELFINNDELVPHYISLLCYLCENFSNFRKKRLTACSKILNCVMKTDDIELLKSCYNAMKTYKCLSPKLSQMKEDLSKRKLQSTVINYLVLSPPFEVDDELVDLLLTIANQDERGSLILMQVAESEESAGVILENDNWLRMKLPTIENTLKLLLVIFCHQSLREQVSRNQYFIKFLDTAVKQKNSNTGTLTVVCTVIRRINLSKTVRKELKEIHFLSNFIDRAVEIAENMALHSAILLTNTLAEKDFFSEFLDYVDFFADLAKQDGPLSNVAAELIVHLCLYEKCLKAFLKCGMEKFFKKKLKSKNQKISDIAEEFFNILDGDDGYNEYD